MIDGSFGACGKLRGHAGGLDIKTKLLTLEKAILVETVY